MSTIDIFKAISDKISFAVFRAIAHAEHYDDDDIFMSKMKLAPHDDRYYSALSKLLQVGLIEKNDRKYSLSKLGKLVYDTQLIIEDAVDNYPQLRIIENLLEDKRISEEEFTRLVNRLINNDKLRETSMRRFKASFPSYES